MKNGPLDLIVWPETAVTDDVIENKYVNDVIWKFISDHNVDMLIGSALLKEGHDNNSAVLFDNNGDVVGVYTKKHVIPFVEYDPIKSSTLKNIFYKNTFSFAPREQEGHFKVGLEKISFGVGICSEDGYASVFKDMINQDAGFAVIMLNDEILRDRSAFFMHLQLSIMNAVSFGMPTIRSSNSGITAYIDERGRASFDDGSLRNKKDYHFQIPRRTGRTVYSQYGDIFAVLCGVFAIMHLLKTLFIKRKFK
jgi:apolipoprotein N-acyltransferase